MKRLLFAAALTVAILPAHAADVGVSVSIGQPGFYGHIDINGGGYPPPRVLYREPMVVQRVAMHRPPIYLRVPPGHARHWSKLSRVSARSIAFHRGSATAWRGRSAAPAR